MNAIRIKRHIDSETLTFPELRALIGKDVEIIFLEDEKQIIKPAGSGSFADTGGSVPDFDEEAFWKSREISKI